MLHADKPKELVEFLINLGAYSYPDTIALPAGYMPPSMAIKPTYWKVSVNFMVLSLGH